MHLFKFISLTVLLTSSASAITITSGYIVNDVSNVQGSGPFSLTFSDGNTVTGTSYGDPLGWPPEVRQAVKTLPTVR